MTGRQPPRRVDQALREKGERRRLSGRAGQLVTTPHTGSYIDQRAQQPACDPAAGSDGLSEPGSRVR